MPQSTLHDQWEHLFSHSVAPGVSTPKQTIGSDSPRICRFCDRAEPAASFRNLSHVIPAAFGNRSLFCNEECDDCNRSGSVLESDLANFLALPRALSRIPSRKGFPKIKTKASQQAFAQIQGEDRHLYTYEPTDTEGIRSQDDGNGNLRLTINTPAHRPMNAAKALGRMALFSYPRNRSGFDTLREWVCGAYDWFPVPLAVVRLPFGGSLQALAFFCHAFALAPGRNVIRAGFLYSNCMTILPIALDKKPLPEGLPLINFPYPFELTMMESTSMFFIDRDFVEQEGTGEAFISYRERVKVPNPPSP